MRAKLAHQRCFFMQSGTYIGANEMLAFIFIGFLAAIARGERHDSTTPINEEFVELCIHIYCVPSLPWHPLASFVFAHKFT